MLCEGRETLVQFGGYDAGGQVGELADGRHQEGHLIRGHALADEWFPEVALEDLAESVGDAADGLHEGLVFVEDLRDGDSQSHCGSAEIEEGFVGDHQLHPVQVDQADLDGPLDVFLGGEAAGDRFEYRRTRRPVPSFSGS